MSRVTECGDSRSLRWRGAGLLALAMAVVTLTDAARARDEIPGERPPESHALLINGGKSPRSNAQSHLHHLQDMVRELQGRGMPLERIHVFSSDGQSPEKDMAVRAVKDPRFWLVERTREGRALHKTELTDTRWRVPNLRPARMEELEPWFEKRAEDLLPGDSLFIFVTDHGTRNKEDPENGFISLWEEDLSVRDFKRLLSFLKPGVRVVQVMSQCYSGGFSASMSPEGGQFPDGNTCGFYSTSADRKAYGCYPEGRDRDRIGHAFRVIDALSRHATVADAHLEVLVTDTTPDLPLRTSDLFLEGILREEAERSGTTLDALVDDLLAEAWLDRGRWEAEIRLIDEVGRAYDTFSPRSLSELGTAIEELESLSNQLETYSNRWRSALDDLRKENLRRFIADRKDWGERLDREALKDLGPEERALLLDEFLTDVKAFTQARPVVWERMTRLRENRGVAQAAYFRVETRLAAQLRMRAILIRVAGRHFLEGQAAEDLRRIALISLAECEEFVPGRFDASSSPKPDRARGKGLPPFEEDREAVEKILPSWLGIRFRTAPPEMQDELDLEGGTVQVQEVYETSPAGVGGIEPGDLVLGPPGEPFLEPNQIREWTMTSARGKDLPLQVMRDGRLMLVEVSLEPYPIKMPDLPKPPKEGDPAPSLGEVEVLRGAESLEVTKGRHLLFFWATWCLPCKKSVPELMEWSRTSGVPVVAMTDEYAATVKRFLERRKEPFPELVATDTARESFRKYGVSGTPTFALVSEDGRIEWRKTGYRPDEGLGIELPEGEPEEGQEPQAVH